MYVRLGESDKVGKGRDSGPMMQETEIIDALYVYPELTYIDEALLMLERYEKIEV